MHLRQLRLRLGEYGLNPFEWCLEILSQQAGLTRVVISRRDGQAMAMEGWAVRGRWLSVALMDSVYTE